MIAFYFPQFHSIPENDLWWGKGFQDWLLVKNAKPNFEGHNQPRVPLNGYYNPCDKDVLKFQIDLAHEYGISGFMFYHYWFDYFEWDFRHVGGGIDISPEIPSCCGR